MTPIKSFSKPAYEVADVFRLYGPSYRQNHRLPLSHHKVMNDIERCRTAALGGHVDQCNLCGHEQISYNSCRNRHCPKCQGQARRKWVEARKAQLLPIEYFHVVFTLPDTINELYHYNKRLILSLLFEATSKTLLEFGWRHFKGEIGFTAVLHTWSQTLLDHLHLHCIVPGGALSRSAKEFTKCPKGYLFPVRALSLVFRGKFCSGLAQAYHQDKLKGHDKLEILSSPESFRTYLNKLHQHGWMVYAKRPFAGPEAVIEYVGRYTHKVAITNHRIFAIEDGKVRFQWKDYRDQSKKKLMTLDAQEFIRRFLLHVLPKDFVRIRHYGLLANGQRQKLQLCRELLPCAENTDFVQPNTVVDPQHQEQSDIKQDHCQRCGVGVMQWKADIAQTNRFIPFKPQRSFLPLAVLT